MQKIFTSTVVKAAYVLAFFLLGISAKTNAQLAAGALSFDGVDDYVNVPSVNILNQLPLTIEAWVKPDMRTDGIALTDFGNNVISNDLTNQYGTGFGVVVLNNSVSGIITAYNDGFRYISTPLTAGTWYHVSVVYTPGNVKTYLNGNLLESQNFTQNYTSSSSLIRIGKYNDDNSLGTKRYFKGDVDEVRIWNRALCQGEIMNNMNCEVSLPQNGLYSYYKFNVGLIGVLNSLFATLPDVSGNNNDGTLTNFALTGVLSNWVAGKATGTCNSFTIPPATITMGGSATICQNDSVLMTANSANAYQWYNFGVAIQGATSQTYYAKQTGEYTVAVTTGMCTITSAVQNITVNPVPSIFINATSTSICAGIPVSMSLNGSNDALNAASFNSVNNNDYVTIAHQSQLNPSVITVEAWVRPSTQSGGDKGIIMKLPASNSGQVGYGLRLTSNNRFQFIIGSIGNEVFAQSAVQTIGPWYHLTGTYDGNVIRLYVNGTLAGSAVATGALTSTAPIIVGNSNTMSQPFKGTIDELRIWNNVKTSTQISCDYKIAADPTSSNLVGYWRMNTSSGTATPDITSYHNDGVIANTTSLIASTASVGNTYKWEAAPGLTNLNNACITITPSTTTTFKGIATNSYGCSAKDSVTVTVFPSGQTFNVTGSGTYCIGGPGLPIGLSGSQVGISYQLKKGAVNVGGLVAGTGSPITIGLATETGSYTVIALNNNCTNTMSGSAIVTAVSTPEINLISKINPVCNGDSTGAIDLNVSGGTSPRTYTWNNVVASEDLSNIPAGTYILKVSDLNGCTDADTFTLTEPTAPVMSAVVDNVTCNGLSDGSINLTTGGTAPYIYTWSNTANTKNVTNLAPGTYHVSVEDATGCTSNKTYIVTEPGILSPVLTPVNISCGGNLDGAVNMTVSGGTTPYTYQWSNNATTKNIGSLAAGTYTVDVTDAHGCNAGASATVTQGAALSVNGVATDITCYGANNGSIQLTPATGMAPYTYLWNDNSAAQNRSNLAPGTYSVMVTDSRNCTTSGSYTISQSASALTTSVAKTNVLCNNAGNGAVDLTVNGGTAPYIYTWSNSATTQDLSAIPAGTYSVTVKDAKNCIVNTSATVTEPAVLQLSAAVTKAYCGNATGDVDLTVSGGTTPYTYVWSNNTATQDLNNVHAGTYNVTVTDANGCSANGSYVIGDTSSISLNGTVTNPICGGQSNGTITLTVNGGIAPFTYAWDDNATTQNRTQLAAGTYSVVVTDDGGCSVPATFTVEEPAPITIVGDVLNASCNAASEAGSSINDGAIYLTLDGGTAPYSFVWTDTAYYDNTQDIEFLGAGTYHVTVTDDNGCTASESFVVTEPALINIAANVTNVGCNNTPGAITTVVTGGNAPYFYQWSNNEPTDYIADLTAGTYTLTVYDDWGCVSTGTYQVGADSLTLSKTVANATCNNAANGAIDVTASSSSFPVTYSWSNNATTQDLNNIPAGTYTLTATNGTGCTATLTAIVQQPAAITVTATTTNALCGSNTGTVTLTVNGGTAPYTYHWNNNATTKDINGVVAGNYNVTITDANGCTAMASATVGQTSANVVATASATNATCGNNNGTITLSISGGTAPFTYVWNNSATSQNLSGLGAGNYSVIVTDANGCTATATATVNQAGSNITATATATNAICTANNGSITLAISGGAAPYTYQWSNNATTQNISALSAGTYSVVITDANGCGANASATVGQATANITVTASATNTTCGSNNGAINLTVNGGTAPYTYSWGNNITTQNRTNLAAGSYSVTVTDANGCTKTISATVNQSTAITATATATNASCNANTGSVTLTVSDGTAPYTYLWSNNATTQNLSNVGGGTYTVTITDVNGCTKTANATVSQSTTNITVTGTVTNVTCNGGNNGAVNLTISGGTSPYTYSWTGGATSKNISGKTAGTYTVVVTDANGCSKTATFTIAQPAAIVLSATLTNISCHGNANGSIDLSVTGGTAPYTYNWDLGSNSNTNCNWWWWWCNYNYSNNNSASTQDVSGLDAGAYSVTVTDANGCTTTGSYTITEPSTLSVNVAKTNVSCKNGNNGTITLTVNGGTAPYSYSWSNNATTQNLNGLTAGSYSVTITDAHGCTENETVNIYQPNNGISASGTVTNVTCKGSSTGSINLGVSGGSSPYTYSWTGGATTQDLNNRAAGTYTVLITDANGCSLSKTFTITEPATALSISAVVSNVSCKDGDNGSINLSVSGGSAPYSYNWNLGGSNNNNNCYNWWWWWCNNNCNNNNNSAHSQDVNDLAEGNYSVTVTDANGCSVSATYTVTEPATALSVSVSKSNVTCKNGNNGTITLSVSGGVTPYSYNWGGNVTTQNRNNLAAGTYNVTITDANGCTKTASATITEPSNGISITGTVTNVSCNNGNNGTVNASVSGGSSPYTYSWTGGATTQDISNKVAGTYTLTVNDAGGCSANKIFTITEPSAITASISVSPAVTVTNGQPYTIYDGYGPQSVTLSVNANGGNGGYSYSWSPASSCSNSHIANPTVSPNSTTTYTVTITDNKGCTKTVSQIIKVVDVRCGNNNNKVIVCHNGNEICVSENAVQAHLNHGCSVGPCSNNAKNNSVIEEEEDNHEASNIQSLVGKDIRVYPNPSKGIFLLELPQGVMNASVLITDVSGRIVERRITMGENTIRFDLSKVAQGMYMIQVAVGNDRYQSRITIE